MDHSLTQTPECYNSVHMETPKAKENVQIEEQTMYEGENSNLTVGIRVRPMNVKYVMES